MATPKVLIIEDEVDLIKSLEYALRNGGFEVESAALGREGQALARSWKPDVIFLDLMLPDVPGTEICRTLKADPTTSAIPVIMVTARSDEVDRVVGFELGADDYVVKPFSVRELLLRARAVLRRGEPLAPTSSIHVGLLNIDCDAHRVWVNDVEVALTAREFKLLVTLATRQGRVNTREMLLTEVWGFNLYVETRTIDTHVKRLREKLGSAGTLIETVRGIGYRFAAAA
jgi:two-component system, OmpR family, phosphate regulon response regulator PhoB